MSKDQDDFRSDWREGERQFYWTMPRILFAIVVVSVLFGAAGWGLNILSQPGRIVSKTLDADNVLNNYEWFHDANGNFKAKVAQVKQQKTFLADASNTADEKNRERIELGAISQSCRDLANRYNANAAKINRGIFRANSLPDQLDAGECQ